MTKEEYNKRLFELKEELYKKEKELAKEYALSNNPYKVGDILQDHYQIIMVEVIGWTNATLSEFPECVFYGTQLTKMFVPKKRQDISPRMYQSNVKAKLN